MNNVICYFNNAATTWPKPQCVVNTVCNSFKDPLVNSSRHCNCIKKTTDFDVVCKKKIKELLNVNDTYDVILTNGATYSANIVINWISKKNSDIKLITDNCCHNCIYRTHYEKIGSKPIIIKDWNLLNIDNNSYYIAICHMNNVDGTLIDESSLSKIISQARKFNIPVIIDITQSAGTYDINISSYNYDNLYIICSGHKGLYSIQGVGFLICPHNSINIPLISGGTGGVDGIDYKHTNSLEAGTCNEIAVNSLIAGIDYVKKNINNIKIIKRMLVEYFISKYKNVSKQWQDLFTPVTIKNFESGIISLRMKDIDKCSYVIQKLTDEYGIVVRSGVHCSPLYHINILYCESTLRLSFSHFNTKSEIDYFYDSIDKIFQHTSIT